MLHSTAQNGCWYCPFPQEVIIRITPARIRKVQILSHQAVLRRHITVLRKLSYAKTVVPSCAGGEQSSGGELYSSLLHPRLADSSSDFIPPRAHRKVCSRSQKFIDLNGIPDLYQSMMKLV